MLRDAVVAEVLEVAASIAIARRFLRLRSAVGKYHSVKSAGASNMTRANWWTSDTSFPREVKGWPWLSTCRGAPGSPTLL